MSRILFGVTAPSTAHSFLRPQLVALIDKGWEVHLASSPGIALEGLKQIPGLNVHSIPMKRNPNPFTDIVGLYQWQQLISEVSPQIVVGSTPKAGLLSMVGAKWRKIPVRIYHARGFRAEGLSGITKRISLLAEKFSISCSTKVICDSKSLLEALVDSGCLQRHHGVVLGAGSCCGVDTDFFHPPSSSERKVARERLNLNDKDLVIGFIGRVTKDKGVKELAKAVLALKEIYPNVRLILVGPDEGGVDYIGDLLRHHEIEYIGPVDDVRSCYWAFDIFALPSYREGFPIAPLEAQSCGVPLVTTIATGCVDSQPPNSSFLSVVPRDVDSLLEALKYLCADRDVREKLGMEARKWVIENFTSTDVIDQQVTFLHEQLAN